MNWRAQARCAGSATILFFPGKSMPAPEARALCAECPVRAECLDENLFEEYGIFGGLSVKERRRVVRGLPLGDRRCERCEDRFVPRRGTHRFCSPACASRAASSRWAASHRESLNAQRRVRRSRASEGAA